jgi:hypothetical protein
MEGAPGTSAWFTGISAMAPTEPTAQLVARARMRMSLISADSDRGTSRVTAPPTRSTEANKVTVKIASVNAPRPAGSKKRLVTTVVKKATGSPPKRYTAVLAARPATLRLREGFTAAEGT